MFNLSKIVRPFRLCFYVLLLSFFCVSFPIGQLQAKEISSCLAPQSMAKEGAGSGSQKIRSKRMHDYYLSVFALLLSQTLVFGQVNTVIPLGDSALNPILLPDTSKGPSKDSAQKNILLNPLKMAWQVLLQNPKLLDPNFRDRVSFETIFGFYSESELSPDTDPNLKDFVLSAYIKMDLMIISTLEKKAETIKLTKEEEALRVKVWKHFRQCKKERSKIGTESNPKTPHVPTPETPKKCRPSSNDSGLSESAEFREYGACDSVRIQEAKAQITDSANLLLSPEPGVTVKDLSAWLEFLVAEFNLERLHPGGLPTELRNAIQDLRKAFKAKLGESPEELLRDPAFKEIVRILMKLYEDDPGLSGMLKKLLEGKSPREAFKNSWLLPTENTDKKITPNPPIKIKEDTTREEEEEIEEEPEESLSVAPDTSFKALGLAYAEAYKMVYGEEPYKDYSIHDQGSHAEPQIPDSLPDLGPSFLALMTAIETVRNNQEASASRPKGSLLLDKYCRWMVNTLTGKRTRKPLSNEETLALERSIKIMKSTAGSSPVAPAASATVAVVAGPIIDDYFSLSNVAKSS